MSRVFGPSGCFVIIVVSIAAQLVGGGRCSANVTREEVERAIREGVRYLKSQQRADGSWSDVENEAKTGTTSLVTLALLTAGEKPESPTIHKALDYLRGFGPNDLKSTYAIALQTMVFAAAEPERDQLRIAANVAWLERAQIKPADPVNWPGSWTYSDSKRARPGDNSNTQYALLGSARRQRGRRSRQARGLGPGAALLGAEPEARRQLGLYARLDQPDRQHDLRRGLQPDHHGPAPVPGPGIPPGRDDPELRQGRNQPQPPGGNRLAGQALPGRVRISATASSGSSTISMAWSAPAGWRACGSSARTTGIAWAPRSWSTNRTSSAGSGRARSTKRIRSWRPASRCLFLAKGRAPVLINKLRHAPSGDWNNDPDDVRNIVDIVSRDWKSLLTWQVVDPDDRHVAGAAPGPHHLLQRPPRPRVLGHRQAEPPRIRRARRLPLRRGLLRQPRVRPGLQAV